MRTTILIAFSIFAPVLLGQSRQDEFLAAKSWRGSFDMSVKSEGSANGYTWKLDGTATADMVFDQYDADFHRFKGTFPASNLSFKVEYSYSKNNCSYTVTGDTGGPFDPYTGRSVEAELRIYLNVWSVSYIRNTRPITYVQKENCAGVSRTSSITLSILIPVASPEFKYPAQGLILDDRGTALQLGVIGFDGPTQIQTLTWNVHYHVEPVLDELRLEITSSKYDTWRPSAEPGPQSCESCAAEPPQPGESIDFTATVKQASGQTAQVEVDRFVWELGDTSREPGIALNSPFLINDSDKEPDLKLDPQPGQVATGNDGQKVERSSPDSPEDHAVVLPYDWGGWSTLHATAYLKDGRKLVGKYQGSEEEGVRLPKRAKDSYIADAWKNQTGASGADQDDKEKEPIGEDGCDGDGLTLYEEYRGFYENGKHIEGNPKSKDLFVFNQCGAVAEPGIALFQSLTGLQVHKDLREFERNTLDRDYTAINGNFDKGPHRVVQHRVEITWCGTSLGGGGGTRSLHPAFSDSHHMRPKDVENIYVERPDSRYWTQQYGVSSDDQGRQFDVALAHELMHAVGVEHHGEGDTTWRFEAKIAETNPTGHPAWVIWGTDTVVTFLEEATGADISESTATRALAVRDLAAQLTDVPAAVQALVEGPEWFIQNYQVGVENGESSGDEDCVMRYWLSDAYPKKGADKTLYLVPPGTEPVGTQLCTSTNGKTINADRNPQPRYFNAAETRGNCKYWVCVNDAIPPKSSEIPEKKPQ